MLISIINYNNFVQNILTQEEQQQKEMFTVLELFY